MLIMFKVRNYTSFKNEAILDMRAASYKQHATHLLETHDGTKLVKTAAIYGANASGKSNFISAMFFFEKYIFDQFISKNDAEEFDFSNKFLETRLEPFQLSKDNNEASEFSNQVSELATSVEVINELSDEIGVPKNYETEDEFVERAKATLTKILKRKLSK